MAYDQLKLQNQLCFRLYTASRLITQTYFPMLDKLGLTYPQYLVLMALWEEDGQKVMELAHRLYLDSNTMTPLVKRMASEGLVTRVKGKLDARETYVYLTDKAKELERQAASIPACMLGKVLSDRTSVDDIHLLSAELDALINTLSEQRAQDKAAAKDKECRYIL